MDQSVRYAYWQKKCFSSILTACDIDVAVIESTSTTEESCDEGYEGDGVDVSTFEILC
jgi:hypothetical protein